MDIPADAISQMAKPVTSKLSAIPRDEMLGHCYSLCFFLPAGTPLKRYWERTSSALSRWDRDSFLVTPTLLTELDRSVAAVDWRGFLNAANTLLFFNRMWADRYASQAEAFFDPMNKTFVRRLMKGMRQVEAGQEAIKILKVHKISVTVYKVPFALQNHVSCGGLYSVHQPAVDLFAHESRWQQRGERLLHLESYCAHEQRHASQFMDPALYAMMDDILKRTFLASLLITKIIEADAKAYQRRYEEQAAQSEKPPMVRQKGGLLESLPLAVSFMAALDNQAYYHDQTECLKVRRQTRFAGEWDSLMTQIEDKSTPLGRVCSDFIMAVTCLHPGLASYLSLFDGKITDVLRKVPVAEPQKFQAAA